MGGKSNNSWQKNHPAVGFEFPVSRPFLWVSVVAFMEMQFDKKAMVQKFEEVDDERQKEAKLIRNQMLKEREETREILSSESKAMQDGLDNTVRDVLDVIKKERGEREREIDNVKRRIDDEKDALKQVIDRDRDNVTRKMNEEHDQRRIEQMEMTQRLGNNKCLIEVHVYNVNV